MKGKLIVLAGLCFIFIIAVLFSCNSHKADIVYPKCDTTGVVISLKTDLTPILEVNCFNCHSALNAPVIGGGFNLQDYNTIKDRVDTTGRGILISRIQHITIYISPKNDTSYISPSMFMPKSGGMLDTCAINKFIAWGKQGHQNN